MRRTTLAERIRTRRLELGLTVDDLANAAGVSYVAVRKWEKSETSNLKHEHLFTIADALNVSPRWLALGEGQKEATDSRGAYSNALTRRESASSDKARRAWERIALSFAKAAVVVMMALGLNFSFNNNVFAAPFARQVFDGNTHWRVFRWLRRALSWITSHPQRIPDAEIA